MKAMAMSLSLYGPKQKANGKTTKEGKKKVVHGVGDEEFLPPEGEENLSVYSDDDESSRLQAKKISGKSYGSRKKERHFYYSQVLRKSQRNQEEGGSSNGATSTLPRQPLADHGQVMSVVATNDQHASQKEKGPITRHYSSKDAIKCCEKIHHVHIPDVKWGPVGKNASLFKTEVGIVRMSPICSVECAILE